MQNCMKSEQVLSKLDYGWWEDNYLKIEQINVIDKNLFILIDVCFIRD